MVDETRVSLEITFPGEIEGVSPTFKCDGHVDDEYFVFEGQDDVGSLGWCPEPVGFRIEC